MISIRLLKELLQIWEFSGYDSFKEEIRELGLLKKGFTVDEIRRTILNDEDIMDGYIKISDYEVKEISK